MRLPRSLNRTFAASTKVIYSFDLTTRTSHIFDYFPLGQPFIAFHRTLIYSTLHPKEQNTSHPSRLPPNKTLLSLDHFLLRQRVLALYRTILRTCHRLPDAATREEMRRYAREEFEQRRGVTELRQIRYLLSTGKGEFERLGKQISGGGGVF